MTRDEAMARLKALGDEKQRQYAIKNGAGENTFGVKMGDLRVLAKEIKSNHDLGLELWETGNLEARLLGILIMKPKLLSVEQLEEMVKSVSYAWLADWLNSYVVKVHPEKEALRQKWMQSDNPMLARSAWSLTTERINKNPDGLDMEALLNRIEKEMGNAHEMPQWTMNFALIGIGTDHPEHRDRALAIGEKLGVYRDYPCSKGCTSPFAPIAIKELASRKA